MGIADVSVPEVELQKSASRGGFRQDLLRVPVILQARRLSHGQHPWYPPSPSDAENVPSGHEHPSWTDTAGLRARRPGRVGCHPHLSARKQHKVPTFFVRHPRVLLAGIQAFKNHWIPARGMRG